MQYQRRNAHRRQIYLIRSRIDLKPHMEISYVQEHEDEFVEMITKKIRADVEWSLRDGKRELEQSHARIYKLDEIIQRLYEDNIEGKISDERFAKMSENYETEQKTLESRVVELRSQIAT